MLRNTKAFLYIMLSGLLLLTSCSSVGTTQWEVNKSIYDGGKLKGYSQWLIDIPSNWTLQESESESTYFKTDLGEFRLEFIQDQIDDDFLSDPYYFSFDTAETISLVGGDVVYLKLGSEHTFLYQVSNDIVAEFFFSKDSGFDLAKAKKELDPIIQSLTLVEYEAIGDANASTIDRSASPYEIRETLF